MEYKNQSEQTDQLDLALLAMQQEFGVTIGKDKKGHVASYAGLPGILEWISSHAGKHGLVLRQGTLIIDGINSLESKLLHPSSKQFISCRSYLTPQENSKNEDHAWGGSTTYQRRYQAMMLLGLFCDNDVTDRDRQESPRVQEVSMENAPAAIREVFGERSEYISEKQHGFFLMKCKDSPENAQFVREKYANTKQIPWKKFQNVLNFLAGQTDNLE